MSIIRSFKCIVFCVALCSANANAASFVVDSNGAAIGATDIMIGSTSWDVSFQDRSCNALYSGCNRALFPFRNLVEANEAAESLYLQAFSQFQTTAGLTHVNGCAQGTWCRINIFYEDIYDSPSVYVIDYNVGPPGYAGGIAASNDTLADINFTNSSWRLTATSTVPVPAAAWLFGSGLVSLMGFASRRFKAA